MQETSLHEKPLIALRYRGSSYHSVALPLPRKTAVLRGESAREGLWSDSTGQQERRCVWILIYYFLLLLSLSPFL